MTGQRLLSKKDTAGVLEKCRTGIRGLDEITNGGLPRGRQVESQGRDFVEHSGFTERLYTVRGQARNGKMPDPSDKAPTPACPLCGKFMRHSVPPGRDRTQDTPSGAVPPIPSSRAYGTRPTCPTNQPQERGNERPHTTQS